MTTFLDAMTAHEWAKKCCRKWCGRHSTDNLVEKWVRDVCEEHRDEIEICTTEQRSAALDAAEKLEQCMFYLRQAAGCLAHEKHDMPAALLRIQPYYETLQGVVGICMLCVHGGQTVQQVSERCPAADTTQSVAEWCRVEAQAWRALVALYDEALMRDTTEGRR